LDHQLNTSADRVSNLKGTIDSGVLNTLGTVQQYSKPNLVVGLGLTGFSVVEYLIKKGSNVEVVDSRATPPYLRQLRESYPQVPVITGKIPYSRFNCYDQVIVSPGIAINSDAAVIGDIELFAREANASVIGITGSNGKSTVTMLVSEMLEAAGMTVRTGGNIGTPALDLLSDSIPDFYVLELSSFQLETTDSLKAEAVTILNITEDHMDRYPNFAAYRQAKLRILKNTLYTVINRDEAVLSDIKNCQKKCISFGLNAPPTRNDFGLSGVGDNRTLIMGSKAIAPIMDMKMLGLQNISNILAAMALVSSVGVNLSKGVVHAALSYPGLPHRSELVTERKKVKWINDSKGTNVGATIAAINSLQSDIILLLGGQGKGADFTPLASALKGKVKQAIVFGEDANQIKMAIRDLTIVHDAKNLECAVALANQLATSGQTVLFSPACASFDMFENYAQRGDIFKSLVSALGS